MVRVLHCDLCDCCRQLELSGENVAMPLRMVEICTDPKTYAGASSDVVYTLVQHLVRNGECHSSRRLLLLAFCVCSAGLYWTSAVQVLA